MEKILVKRIENNTRLIKLGKLLPKDSSIGKDLSRLKNINLGLYQDLLNNYIYIINKIKVI